MVTRPTASTYALLASSWLTIACQPEFTERTSAVTALRILAIESDPAEANPNDGQDIAYSALVADVSGTQTMLTIDWAFCTLPTPVSELNDVSPLCFQQVGDYIKPFPQQMGISATAKLPFLPGQNSCNQFGPDLPQSADGGPPGRPADPDSTGGFYQPVRVLYANARSEYDFTLAQTRIKCNLPGATAEVAADYKDRYRLNQNPEIDSMVATVGTAPGVDLKTEDKGDSGLVVSPGAAVTLTASYASCPTVPACGNGICEAKEDSTTCAMDCMMMPKGCTGAEPYVFFDLSSRALVNRRESIRLSWFTNKGSFSDDRTGNTEQQTDATSTQNTWTAPKETATATVWAVLRDSRGGLTWKAYKITVQ